MHQTRFNNIWIFVVSFFSLSTLLFFGAERLPGLLARNAIGNRNGRSFLISKKQVANSSAETRGDLYLLGVGKADITGYVETKESNMC
jgi:hypothetical protein